MRGASGLSSGRALVRRAPEAASSRAAQQQASSGDRGQEEPRGARLSKLELVRPPALWRGMLSRRKGSLQELSGARGPAGDAVALGVSSSWQDGVSSKDTKETKRLSRSSTERKAPRGPSHLSSGAHQDIEVERERARRAAAEPACTARGATLDSSEDDTDADEFSAFLTQRDPSETQQDADALRDVLGLLHDDVSRQLLSENATGPRVTRPLKENFLVKGERKIDSREVLSDSTNTRPGDPGLSRDGSSAAQAWDLEEGSNEDEAEFDSEEEVEDVEEAGPPGAGEGGALQDPLSCKRKITDFFGSGKMSEDSVKLRGIKPCSAKTSKNGDKPLTRDQQTSRGHNQATGGAAEWGGEQSGKADTLPRKNGSSKEAPIWEKIPGTSFRVDGFQHQTPQCSHWFLTHFHSDHYAGLTKSFRYGTIYCSPITAALVKLKLGVPDEKLKVLELNSRTEIDGVGVTLLDANHCPGAVMILFEPPNAYAVLHTGDFRWAPRFAACPILTSVSVHTLILDTTYCDPKYDFPSQDEAIQLAVDAALAEAFNPQVLFLVGTYGIGKERVMFEVARALGRRIYVGAAKRKMLECMGLSHEDMSLITDNEAGTNVHAVPLWSVSSFQRMQRLANFFQSAYSTIVALCPTGWSFGQAKKKRPTKRSQRGTLVRYELPYSEHSSFQELCTFVRQVKPQVVVPSVGNSGEESAQHIVSLLRSGDGPL